MGAIESRDLGMCDIINLLSRFCSTVLFHVHDLKRQLHGVRAKINLTRTLREVQNRVRSLCKIMANDSSRPEKTLMIDFVPVFLMHIDLSYKLFISNETKTL